MKYILPILTLFLCGCTTLTFLKIDNDGYYRFKSQPIQVKAPFEKSGDFSVFDTENSVDFTFGTGYWMFMGQYAVEVFPAEVVLSSKDAFIKKNLDGAMQTYIKMDRKEAGFNFEVIKIEATEINGRSAVRAIGVDRKAKVPAVFIATSILLESRIVVGSLIYPLEKVRDSDISDFAHWKMYNTWIETISEKK